MARSKHRRTAKARTYNLWAINDRSKKRYLLTREPVTLDEAHTIRRKFKSHKSRRIVLEEF